MDSFSNLFYYPKTIHRKVLILEDDSDGELLIRKSLEKAALELDEEIEFFSAITAEHAIDIVKKQNIDFVIADIQLAGEADGLMFHEYCLENNVNCPFIFVSGTQAEKFYDHFAGSFGKWPRFIHKPVQPSILIEFFKAEVDDGYYNN